MLTSDSMKPYVLKMLSAIMGENLIISASNGNTNTLFPVFYSSFFVKEKN